MRLSIASRSYDLDTRALVMGALGRPDDLVEQGADIVELAESDPSLPVPVCVVAADDSQLQRALAAGATLLRLPRPGTAALRSCAMAGATVILPADATTQAAEAGLAPGRTLLDTLVLDVTGAPCPVAATAAGVVRGARIVRTRDVRRARRICDVLAAVMEARS